MISCCTDDYTGHFIQGDSAINEWNCNFTIGPGQLFLDPINFTPDKAQVCNYIDVTQTKYLT